MSTILLYAPVGVTEVVLDATTYTVASDRTVTVPLSYYTELLEGGFSLSVPQNAGTKNGATVSVVESGDDIMHRTILTCTATPITITDDAGVAQYGGVKVYDFPEGLIKLVSARVKGSLTAGVTGTIIDNWDGDVALGSVTATTGATLVSTEATYMASVPVSAGTTDKIGVVAAVGILDVVPQDGTATAKDLFLNFVIDDDATHTSGTATFTGTIEFTWLSGGDN